MTVIDEKARILKGSNVAYLKVLYWLSSGKTEHGKIDGNLDEIRISINTSNENLTSKTQLLLPPHKFALPTS
jgi:hypothetical protein